MSTELAVAGGALQAAYGAFSPAVLVEQVQLIQKAMKEVMIEGQHFGKIPGCGDKPTLLKPGSEKLAFLFRLAMEIQEQVIDLGGGHREYRVKCRLTSIQTGAFVGEGVGCCSTMESKYRYRQAARKCPKCGKETIIKGKAEYGGGWVCFAKKGGCNAKWPDGAAEIEGQHVGRIENEDPADSYNTCLKMAKKRASIDAVLTATAASDIFAQDLEDLHDAEPDAPPAKPQRQAPQQAPRPQLDAKQEHQLSNLIARRFPQAEHPDGPPISFWQKYGCHNLQTFPSARFEECIKNLLQGIAKMEPVPGKEPLATTEEIDKVMGAAHDLWGDAQAVLDRMHEHYKQDHMRKLTHTQVTELLAWVQRMAAEGIPA